MTPHLKPAELEAITPIVEPKVVNLALQGGGSHGAFTWGVLDRLLEDERLAFDGITATSAGAVNAVVLADGLALGGREGARNALKNFWQKTSQMASSSIIAPSFFDQMNPKFGLEHTPAYVFIDVLSRILSPYQLNPMDINPLKDLLNAEVNFERVRQQKVVKLFLSATNVRSGKVKVFAREEIAADHVLASAGLPFMMRAPGIAQFAARHAGDFVPPLARQQQYPEQRRERARSAGCQRRVDGFACAKATLAIDVISDAICPWCWVAKRRLDRRTQTDS